MARVNNGPPKYELTGTVFGFLTVLGAGPVQHERTMWDCECVCGAFRRVDGYKLRKGFTKSCGCKSKELISGNRLTHGASVARPRSYMIWMGMRKRCYSVNHKDWQRYGGRGITVSAAWDDYPTFLADLGEPPPGMSIERLDNDMGYSKENCIWATPERQQNNRSDNRRLAAHGETLTLAQWARRLGMDVSVISRRLGRGVSVERALSIDRLNKGEL